MLEKIYEKKLAISIEIKLKIIKFIVDISFEVIVFERMEMCASRGS